MIITRSSDSFEKTLKRPESHEHITYPFVNRWMKNLKMNFIIFVSVFYSFTCLSQIHGQHDYSDYDDRACRGEPLCDSRLVRPPTSRRSTYKCSCDSHCTVHGNCCPDSSYYNNPPTKSNETQELPIFSCIESILFYVVKTCPTSFNHTLTKMKCEKTEPGVAYEDVKRMRPVMDKTSQITYLNAYCASCHKVTNYEKFDLSYTCRDMLYKVEREVRPKLANVLNAAKFDKQSGVYKSNLNDTISHCEHKVVIPKDLAPHLMNCEPNLISSCPETFNNPEVIEKCHSHAYAVYTNPSGNSIGKAYRNEYCARCNGIESVQQCQYPSLSYKYGRRSLWDSFPLNSQNLCSNHDLRNVTLCQ